jgi:hypothetical protein
MENGRKKMSEHLIDILLYIIGAGIGIALYNLIFNKNNKNDNLAI